MAEPTDATRHDDSASSPTASELTSHSGHDDSGSASTRYVHSDVFINLRDYNDCNRDVMTFATRLCNRLKSHELQVVLDKPDLLFEEKKIPSKIEDSILGASVHIAIIPPNYAQSKWCLDELVLMIKTSAMSRKRILPVFYYAKPSELRWTSEGNDGACAKALSNYEKQNLYDSRTIQDWKAALLHVANISGFVLDEGRGGEEELLANVVHSVRNDFPYGPRYDVFLNHRGPDVKETFAKSLYDGLVSSGLRVFLDQREFVPGLQMTPQIEVAIQLAHVNIAIFSPNYAESSWCLDELVLMVRSRATILPVFHQIRRSDLVDGVYDEALLNHEKKQRDDSMTIKNWKDALSMVAQLPGYELGGDEKELQHKIVQSVLDSLAERSADVRNSEVEQQRVLKSVLEEDVSKRVSQAVERVPIIEKFQYESGHDDSGSASTRYVHSHVFISLHDYNDCDRDVMTFATRLCNLLKSHELQVVLDKPDFLFEEKKIPSKIKHAILGASVLIAIIPPNYAQSKWCLDELALMVKTKVMSGTRIIPVFYYAKPSELRWTSEGNDGAFAKSLSNYEKQNLYDSRTIQDWKAALLHVANINGFVLDEGPGGEEELLANVVNSVLNVVYGKPYASAAAD